jgi:hypothetical protein
MQVVNFDDVYANALECTPILTLKGDKVEWLPEIEPYHHILFTESLAIVYIWDTRKVTHIMAAEPFISLLSAFKHADDNRMPISMPTDTDLHFSKSKYAATINEFLLK